MTKNRIDRFGKPPLFRSINSLKGERSFSTGSVFNVYETNVASENSFKYDPYGSPLKSTQQLSVDFSKFENHTFFNSGVAKTAIAFNKILNKYPFDGTRYEIEEFEDKLTGYEKYVLDKFPKHSGYLTPTGSSYIEVKNIAGNNFPEYSSKKTGEKILDPNNQSISFEMFLNVPNEATPDMGIFYISGSDIKIESTVKSTLVSDNYFTASLAIKSGSYVRYVETGGIEKGKFNHISFVIDKENSLMTSFVNSEASPRFNGTHHGTVNIAIDKINFNSSFFIGREGTTITRANVSNAYDNFSGSIKDVRIYHQARKRDLIKKDYLKSVYKNDYLVLNFRMNEPTGSYAANAYVLDTSGNALHSEIITEDDDSDFFKNIRSDNQFLNPVTNENKNRTHILFPDYPDVSDLRREIISAGEEYDLLNPNMITKLIPPHYYEEILFEEGENNITAGYSKEITSKSIPGSIDKIKSNILNVILFSWANIFDEIKMFIDSFGNVIFSDYNDQEIVPDQMLLYAAKHLGVELPPIFTSSVAEDFFEGDSTYETVNKNLSLKKIQSLIWKRILADSSYYKKTKGTIESLKTIFRSSGIDPDKMFAFIEKGSNTIYPSDENYEIKNIDVPMISFSGSAANVSEGTLSQYGTSPNKPHLISSILSGSHVGLLTSGSWTYEGYYSFPGDIQSGSVESLVRVQRNKYNSPDASSGILNIVAKKETTTNLTSSFDTVTAYFSDKTDESSVNKLSISNLNIFDGDLWYVSFSKLKEADDENENLDSGDYYTLRCYKCGSSSQNFITSSFKSEVSNISKNIQNENSDSTTSITNGPQIIIGSQSIDFSNEYGIYNIPSSNAEHSDIRHTNFSGKVASIRFWSKSITEKEAISHSKDYRNYGSDNPNINSMFLTGSSKKIFIHLDGNMPVTSSANGNITLNDFTQNEINLLEANKSFLDGFEPDVSVNSYEKFAQFVSANKIDEINSSNKVRLRSLQESPDLSLGYQNLYPVYSIIDNDQINDDARFSIEMSVARILNEKINNEISTVEFLENILGKKNTQFSAVYHELEYYSNNFFKNIKGEINLEKILSVYTWLESSFEEIITKSLPKKTKFLGMNYVVEPHVLERSKIVLHNENAYMVGTENNEVPEETNRISVFTGDITIF